MTEQHNQEKDYCGPAKNDWFSRFLSWLIPDYIVINGEKVYIGFCCKDHDENNGEHGANKAGDKKFKECIRKQLRKAGANRKQVWWHSNKYFVGVRLGNPFYKSGSELLDDLKKEFKRKLKPK
jgi:hypothetical protein